MKTFEIIGRRYSNTCTFYEWDKDHKFPHYEEIESINLGTMPFENLTAAIRWLLTEHPELYYGHSIREVNANTSQPDFSMGAVKDYFVAECGEDFDPRTLLNTPRFL